MGALTLVADLSGHTERVPSLRTLWRAVMSAADSLVDCTWAVGTVGCGALRHARGRVRRNQFMSAALVVRFNALGTTAIQS
jgi:hypothetical protein